MRLKLPVFETERLILREVLPQDIPSYEKNFVDYDVIKHLSSGVPWPYPENGVQTYLENDVFPRQGQDKWVWGIFLKDKQSEIIGTVDISRVANPSNRGFWLGKSYWGQGYMTEAVEPVMDYAFSALGFDKMIFDNAKGNLKSRRIKEKQGARLVDVISASFVNPDYTEMEVWELTAEQWFNNKS